MPFELSSQFEPRGDQQHAIDQLTRSLEAGNRHQTLLGVTGSGKTFTAANVVAALNKPTLVISHNKTLAAQLYSEFKQFFPNNAVEYFVSYFDYYQPEAYIPRTDTYIEKDSSINEEIERLRLSTTSSLLSRGDVIEVQPASDDEQALRIEFFGDEIDRITRFDPLTGHPFDQVTMATLYPAKQFVTPHDKLLRAMRTIREELDERIIFFEKHGRLLEAQRLKM